MSQVCFLLMVLESSTNHIREFTLGIRSKLELCVSKLLHCSTSAQIPLKDLKLLFIFPNVCSNL